MSFGLDRAVSYPNAYAREPRLARRHEGISGDPWSRGRPKCLPERKHFGSFMIHPRAKRGNLYSECRVWFDRVRCRKPEGDDSPELRPRLERATPLRLR